MGCHAEWEGGGIWIDGNRHNPTTLTMTRGRIASNRAVPPTRRRAAAAPPPRCRRAARTRPQRLTCPSRARPDRPPLRTQMHGGAVGFSGFYVHATFDSVVFSGNLATGRMTWTGTPTEPYGNALYLSGGNEGALSWVGGNKVSMCEDWYVACEDTGGTHSEPEPGLLNVGEGCYAEDFTQPRETESGDSFCPSPCYNWRIPEFLAEYSEAFLPESLHSLAMEKPSRSTRALFDSTIVLRNVTVERGEYAGYGEPQGLMIFSQVSDSLSWEDCPPGTYGDPSSDVSEEFVGCPSICSAGFYGNDTRQYTTPYVTCSGPCPEGHYCPKGTGDPLPCEPGTSMPVEGAQSANQCLPCAPGHAMPDFGATECHPCDAGTFAPSAQSATCTPCPGWIVLPDGFWIADAVPERHVRPEWGSQKCHRLHHYGGGVLLARGLVAADAVWRVVALLPGRGGIAEAGVPGLRDVHQHDPQRRSLCPPGWQRGAEDAHVAAALQHRPLLPGGNRDPLPRGRGVRRRREDRM